MTVIAPPGASQRPQARPHESSGDRNATVNPDGGEPGTAGRPDSLLGGRYRLDDLLARGATAEVFRGTDELLGRRVAVKVFDPVDTDLNSVERRRVEVEVLASLNDPHLVTVYDARIDGPGRLGAGSGETCFVVMELVEGPTLAEEIGHGQVEAARVARIGADVAAALETIHRRGLVHRDVKPANILSTRGGAVKLGDFGLARVLTSDDRVTAAPLVMGTAAFFSPEQASGQDVEAPSDVYSLGLVLLEALTGRREYPGSPVESAVARLLRGPVIPPGLPAPWPHLLAAMTSADPDARPTAGAVCAALAAVHPVGELVRTAPLLAPIPPTPGIAALGEPGVQTRTLASRPPRAARSRLARLVIAMFAAAEAVALSAALLISPLSGTSPAAPVGAPIPTGAPTSVRAPASVVTHSSTPTPDARTSSRPRPTTKARPTPQTKPASPARAAPASATTVGTPVNEADPAPATNAPEAVTNAGDAAAAPGVAQGAGASSKKGKAQGSETIKNGSGNGQGKGKQKGAQP